MPDRIIFRSDMDRDLTPPEVDQNFRATADLQNLAGNVLNTAEQAVTQASASAVTAKNEADRSEYWANYVETGADLQELAHQIAALPKIKPVILADFVNSGFLDNRFEFSRASKDWDEEGNEYGINEPVLTDQGLWVSGARTGLYRNALTDQSITVTAREYTISFYGEGSIELSGAHTHTVVSSGERTTYTFTPTAGQLNIIPSGVEKVQLETGKAATPYIPTEGSQVTVAATHQHLDITAEGTFVIEVVPESDGDGDGAYSYLFGFSRGALAGGEIGVSAHKATGALEFYLGFRTNLGTFEPGKRYKFALSFGETVALCMNGELVATVPMTSLEKEVSALQTLGLRRYDIFTMTGYSKNITWFKKRLSVNELKALSL